MSTMRKLVIKSLKEMGYTDIIEAADGALAWEAFASASPQVGLVISDWNMPNCTGVDLLKRVRADGRFKTTPFILVTAEAEKSQVVQAMGAGASGYVVKPFTTEALKSQIESAAKKMAA